MAGKCDVTFRNLGTTDAPNMAKIEKKLFQFPDTVEELQTKLKDEHFGKIGAFTKEGDLAGYILYKKIKTEDGVIKFVIEDIAVDSPYQGKDVGSRLIDLLLNALHPDNITSVDVKVRESNVLGIAFFEKNGFKLDHVEKNPYDGTNEDGYVFTYSIFNQGARNGSPLSVKDGYVEGAGPIPKKLPKQRLEVLFDKLFTLP